jgi:hypothetical protein
MKLSRWILVVTLLVVAGLGFWFAVARWDDASKVASVLSALAGVAAVGVAAWAALRVSTPASRITVKGTGDATSDSGEANTGVRGTSVPEGSTVKIQKTGDARTTGGDANTGLHLEP